MNSMRSKANRRTARTLVQFILSGSFTAFVASMSGGVSPVMAGLVLAASHLTVTWVHNYAEDHELIPEILPAPTLGGKKESP